MGTIAVETEGDEAGIMGAKEFKLDRTGFAELEFVKTDEEDGREVMGCIFPVEVAGEVKTFGVVDYEESNSNQFSDLVWDDLD